MPSEARVGEANARLYDPVLGRFLSPDPYVQEMDFSQNFNRYSYCLNNPFKYVDPNGEVFWLIAAGIFFLFTEPGYEIQKFFLPAALKINIQIFGSDRSSIGFDTSVGTPQMFEGYRNEYGKSYVFKDINGYKGGETRRGKEWSSGYKGYFMKFQHTSYDREGTKYDQHRDKITVGVIPGLVTAEFENDANMHNVFNLPGMPEHEHSDKYLTAQFRLNFLGLQTGMILFTGSPEGAMRDPVTGEYIDNPNIDGKSDVDDYRAGILYCAIGPFKFGINSEKIRNATQNFLHRIKGWETFKVMPIPDRAFWEFGW